MPAMGIKSINLIICTIIAVILFLFFRAEHGTGTIEFFNNTKQPIRLINISQQYKNEVVVFKPIININPGEAKVFIMSGSTDNFYSISVVFADGTRVESGGYFEPNGRIKKIIDSNHITSVKAKTK